MTGQKPQALILIDLQEEYFTPQEPMYIPSGDAVRENAGRLLAAARELDLPVIHVRHISKDPQAKAFGAGSPGVGFAQGVEPLADEAVVTKTRPGAFYQTELDDLLKKAGAETIAICGLMSFMCCDTTAREAQARGYGVIFVEDATAALDLGDISAETIHRVVCAIQAGFFSEVVGTDEVLGRIKG